MLGIWPPPWPPNILNLGPPNILNLPMPMNWGNGLWVHLHVFRQNFIKRVTLCVSMDNITILKCGRLLKEVASRFKKGEKNEQGRIASPENASFRLMSAYMMLK